MTSLTDLYLNNNNLSGAACPMIALIVSALHLTNLLYAAACVQASGLTILFLCPQVLCQQVICT